MPTLTLPRLGETMDSGRVVGWLKRPGEAFRRGETLVEIESDKTVVELPALADGVLREILAGAGQDVAVGEPLCSFDGAAAEAAPIPDAAPSRHREPERGDPGGPQGSMGLDCLAGARSDGARGASAAGERRRATPLARRIAARHGIALDRLRGTGRRGRIEARDVRASLAPDQIAVAPAHPAAMPGPDADAAATAGRAVLLLHGFGGDGQSWSGLVQHLVRCGLRPSAPDLRGASLAELVEAAVARLDATDGPPLDLVGHSLGGVVATLVARARAARVGRLTLIAPAGLGSEIDADFLRGMAEARTGSGLAHLLRRLAVRPPPLSAAQLDAMAAGLAAARLGPLAEALAGGGRQQVDILPDLAALPMPVRVVWGMQDRIIPWMHATHAPSRVALHLIQGAGHMPHWDRPEEVAALFA